MSVPALEKFELLLSRQFYARVVVLIEQFKPAQFGPGQRKPTFQLLKLFRFMKTQADHYAPTAFVELVRVNIHKGLLYLCSGTRASLAMLVEPSAGRPGVRRKRGAPARQDMKSGTPVVFVTEPRVMLRRSATAAVAFAADMQPVVQSQNTARRTTDPLKKKTPI
jgi:hypothetical protein